MSDYTKEQLRAITSMGKNIAVLAGAGSGKTSVLVERFIHLVDSGTDCRRILAITFTNKAASEMAGRIRARMAALAVGDVDAARWREQKKLLSSASISTIHGLCTNILRSYPIEAGIDPGFRIASETQAAFLLQDAVEKVLQRELGRKNTAMLALYKEYDRGGLLEGLAMLAALFTEEQLADDALAEKLATGNREALAALPRLKEVFREHLQLLLSERGEVDPKTAHRATLEELNDRIDEIEAALDGLPGHAEAAASLEQLIGKLSGQNKKDKELVKALKEEAAGLAASYLDSRAEGLIGSWAEAGQRCGKEYAAQKQQNALLTFDDLERLTYRLLCRQPDICAKYAARFDHIMIDEFQDTNELQKQLAYLLAGCQQDKLKNDKLFVVGDAKQSIYRFRGADVSVFGRVRRDMETTGGEEIQLADNFRSTRGILSVCNDLFSCLMGDADNVKFEPLRAHKEDLDEPVAALLIDKEAPGGRCAEAQNIAAYFCNLAAQGGYDYGDMAILLRARTHLTEFTAALEEAGIPYNVLDGQGFFSTPEITDMMNLLACLANSRRTLPLLAVLRSPLFALDDESITFMTLQGGPENLWQTLTGGDFALLAGTQRELAGRAAEKLVKLWQAAQILPPGALLRLIEKELAVQPLLLLYPDGKQKYANLEKFIDLAFAFEEDEGGTLSDFVRHMEDLIAMGTREGMEEIETQNSASVKILTVHKAKGLQFPVVAIPDCGTSFFSDRSFLLYDEKGGLAVKVRGQDGELYHTNFFSRVREKAADANVQEMKRLLYVGMTRAEKKLIISGVRDGGKKDSWLNWLLRCFTEEETCLRGAEGYIVKLPLRDEADRLPIHNHTGATEERDFTALLTKACPLQQNRIKFPEAYSATALLDYRHCARRFYYKYICALPEEEWAGEEGTREGVPANITGLIVHSTLANTKRLGSARALREAVERECPDGADKDKVEKSIAPWLADYTGSPLYAEIAKSEWLGEQAFRIPLLGGRLFAGSIDCLLFNEDGSMDIVDFKTDHSRDNKTSVYEHQLMLYTLAAESLYPDKTVRGAKLHFIRFSEAAEVPINTERARLTGELSRLLEEIEKKTVEKDFPVNSGWCQYCGFRHFCLGAL